MKKILILTMLVSALAGLGLTSCNNDGYSLDNFAVVIATVRTVDQQTFYLETDKGSKLWIAAPVYYHYHVDEGDRVMANITLLSDKIDNFDHYVRLNSLSKIRVKPIIDLTAANADSIGNDKMKVDDIWFAGNKLNVIFGINMGGEAVHYMNLVMNTTVEQPNDGKIHLELRHNANKDKVVFGRKFIVNFDLQKYLVDGKPHTFVIKANTFSEGENFTKEITIVPTETKVNIDNEEIYVNPMDWE